MFLRHHIHSVYSTRDAMLKIDDIIDSCKKSNEAFSMCDHGSIAGWFELFKKCKEAEMKPVFGVEAYVNRNRNRLFKVLKEIQNEKDQNKKRKLQKERDTLNEKHHLVLLAKNEKGFHNIIELCNIGFVDGFYSKPTITYGELIDHKEGIIVTSACLGGPIAKLYSKGKIKNAKEYTMFFKKHFKDDFYLEVQANKIPEQKKFNKFVLKLAKKCGVKICIGSDAHYLNLDWKETHQDLLLLQNKKKRSDVGKSDIRIEWENNKGEIKVRKVNPEKDFRKGTKAKDVKIEDTFGKDVVVSVKDVPRAFVFDGEEPLMSENELKKYVAKNHKELKDNLDEIIKSNYEIYDKIDNIEFNTEIKLPTVENAEEKLTQLVKNGLKELGLIKKKYIKRAKHELKVIKENGFSAYFVILYDFLKYAKDRDIPLGAGRGSGVSSVVGYALGIHRVDPLDPRWNGMPFERFLSAERNFKKIMVEGENGKKIEFLETDKVKLKNGKTKLAIKLKEGDEIK